MKKILIIIGVVIVIVIITAFFVFKKPSSNDNGGVGGTTGTLPPVVAGTSSYVPPTGTTLTLGTPKGNVTVNNFYNNAIQTSADHTAVLILQTDNYNITYYAPDSSFNILITGTPFGTVRPQAEAAFLESLNISQADACRLTVKVGIPVGIDPDNAGQNLGLSFCSSGAFQSQ